MRELTDLERDLLDADRWHDLACLRLDLLERLHARAQRLEATLVLVEDQRDKASKERDSFLADLERVVAERDAAVAERDEAQHELNDLQAGMRQWENEHASAVAGVIAERDSLRKQLDDLKRDYTDTSYWGEK